MTWRPDGKQGEDLVRRVLARTSGSACDRAQGLLPGLVAGELAGLDRDLVSSHAEHCSRCRDLARTLGWLAETLPDMARLDPGVDFTRNVIALTSRAALPRRRPEPGGSPSLAARWRRWWAEQLLRPNFAAEVAYVATVVLVLLAAVPGAPLEGAPGKAQQVIQAGSFEVPAARRLWSTVAGGADQGARWVVRSTVGVAADRARRTAADWRSRAAGTEPARREFHSSLARGAQSLSAGHLDEALDSFENCLAAGGRTWRLWWKQDD